ncbi:amidohydrolase family protein [Anaerolentibacter hominis]|uniref:amidohydrolase family protein n=1 Tax=Anaerolentibacter hominis TaxID=3079009 RepID=UPI0031B83343
MNIIDAHLHFCKADGEYFDRIALAAGHEHSETHLRMVFKQYSIRMGVVMGNRELEPAFHRYPEFLRYCIGIDGSFYNRYGFDRVPELVEENLRRPDCVGIKLYPGYCHSYVSDPRYEPVYELAERYQKPVAIHTGLTAGTTALIKYSHPLTVDEVAVGHPRVQFVLCHIGNPWIPDAVAVMAKCPNVAADLSGLLEGKLDMNRFFEEQSGYISYLKTWITYLSDYSRLLYGTDWPLANVGDYIKLVEHIIPEKYQEQVFFENANRLYRLGLS